MAIETREKKEIPFLEVFSQTKEKYEEMIENKETRKKIVSFLNDSEKKRRITCWGRIRWESSEKKEWTTGKEWENVLVEIFEIKKFFGENSKIWLTHPDDDKKGRDLIIHINQEKDILLAIDLTLNGDKEIINGKFLNSYYDNPVILEVPPEQRKNNPKALKFVLALPKIAGLETMNRFFQALQKKEKLEDFKNEQDFKRDPVVLAVLSEFLEQMKIQLDNLSQKLKLIDPSYEREIENLQNILKNQEENLKEELTPESEEIKKFLKESFMGRMVRTTLQEI